MIIGSITYYDQPENNADYVQTINYNNYANGNNVVVPYRGNAACGADVDIDYGPVLHERCRALRRALLGLLLVGGVVRQRHLDGVDAKLVLPEQLGQGRRRLAVWRRRRRTRAMGVAQRHPRAVLRWRHCAAPLQLTNVIYFQMYCTSCMYSRYGR